MSDNLSKEEMRLKETRLSHLIGYIVSSLALTRLSKLNVSNFTIFEVRLLQYYVLL